MASLADQQHPLGWLLSRDVDPAGPMGISLFHGSVGAAAMGSSTYRWLLANDVDEASRAGACSATATSLACVTAWRRASPGRAKRRVAAASRRGWAPDDCRQPTQEGPPMRVLVAYATKHGATEGIAARIGDALSRAGHDAEVRDAGDVADLTSYDAFVLGSAAYVGHWRKKAIAVAHRLEQDRGDRPIWLFSSGPPVRLRL